MANGKWTSLDPVEKSFEPLLCSKKSETNLMLAERLSALTILPTGLLFLSYLRSQASRVSVWTRNFQYQNKRGQSRTVPASSRKVATNVPGTIWQVAKRNNHKCGTTK